MPRPLYILKNVMEEDSAVTREKIANLIGELQNVSDKAYEYLAQYIRLLTKKDRANRVDRHTVDLGVRIWNDLKLTSELTKNGFYLQAMMVVRDAIEAMALTEYLHSFPNDALAWWKAETKKERLRFSINNIKDKIEDGQEWKDIWDWLSLYIHTNSKATPVYGADKPYYGHNLFLGGFYYPESVEFLFRLQLLLCIEFLKRMMNWYKNEPEFTSKLLMDTDSLEGEYDIQVNYFKGRVESESKEVVGKVISTRLSKDKVIELFRLLDNVR
jgi:hypothetical protein